MAELGIGVLADVAFQLGPYFLVVPDLFADRADGQDALQGLDLGQGFLEIGDQLFPFLDKTLMRAAIFDDLRAFFDGRGQFA